MILFKKKIKSTVIFPTFGSASFSKWALKSVCDQTVIDIEIFIICDGSPKEMINTFREFETNDKRIKLFEFPKSKRTGEPYRDHIIRNYARGKAVFYCSHDDLWFPNHIEELLMALHKYSFAHSIHASINASSYNNCSDDLFHYILNADLSEKIYRDEMLSDTPLRNYFGLTYAAHTRKSYLKLKEGWTTTPEGIYTDLYMWRKFLRKYGNACGTLKRITALNFPAIFRREFTEQMRYDELAYYYDRIQDQRFLQKIKETPIEHKPIIT